MGNHQSHNHNSKSFSPIIPKRGSQKHKSYPCCLTTLSQLLLDKSANDQVDGNISRRVFVKYFSNRVETFAERLYEHYVSRQETLDVHYVSEKTFLFVSEEILDLQTLSHRLKYCFTVFSKGKDHLTREGVESIIRACYLIASNISTSTNGVKSFYSAESQQTVSAMMLSIMRDDESISADNLCTWVRKNSSNMIYGIHQWITSRLLTVDESVFEIETNGHDSSSLQSESMCLQSNVLNPFLLWLLTCSLPVEFTKPKHTKPSFERMLSGHMDPHTFIQKILLCSDSGKWTSLYKSSIQGLSMNRFQHHVFSYRGPTVVLITAEEGRKFCVAVDQEWKESSVRWGGENCCAIQITPKYQVLEAGSKLMYFNLATRGHPLGIQIGHTSKCPTLEIDREMSYIFVRKIPYQLLNIEVWGCAGEEMLEAQVQQKRWEAKETERHHRVNLNAVEWKDNPDKYLLELASTSGGCSYTRDS